MGHENGGWMNDDQRDAVKALAESRPKDVHGEQVVMGPWYWAMTRTGQIAGTGKFLATIGWGEIHFYINGVGFSTESFSAFVKAEKPDYLFQPDLCEHGVKDGDWCEPCNKAMKEGIPEGTYFKDDLDGGRLVGKTPLHGKPLDDNGRIEFSGTAQPLTCGNCGEVSTNPGQFIADGRWVCTERCRQELIQSLSMNDGVPQDAP